MSSVLPRSFYERPTTVVARDLLGKLLVRETTHGRLSLKIVETEAYVGEDDRACHASKGKTERTKIMFGPAGHAYVYLIYGMYDCLNIVTERQDYPAAVLIRAGEPVEGVDTMKKLRPKALKPASLASGPGKLCKAMDITRALNGLDMCKKGPLYVEDTPPEKFEVVTCPRIGVDYAGEDKHRPWRYYVKNNFFISKRSPDDTR